MRRTQKKSMHSLNGVKNYYDKYAPHYDSDPYYEERLYDDLTWLFIEPYLPASRDTPILDIGGGTGKWAVKIAQLGFKVICGDISMEMLKIAQQKAKDLHLEHLISTRELDVRDMQDIPDNSFELVLAVGDVISYAVDDDLAVAEIYRVLKPGGRCIASVDNKLVFIINEIKFNHIERIESLYKTGISHFFKAHEIKTYFPDELKALFERHNFIVEKIVGKPVLTSFLSKKERREKIYPHYDLFLKLEKEMADNPYLVGQGGHLQIIARKPK